jgi:dihydrodipicolinate synthase/N-acetylneuraminate lyase
VLNESNYIAAFVAAAAIPDALYRIDREAVVTTAFRTWATAINAAAAAYARILPLINFENRQCGLRATKAVMAEGGVIASDAVRHPLEALHPATRAGLLELAGEVMPLALRWGK